jgi:hypothetical protein
VIRSLSDTLAQEMLLYGEDVKMHTAFPRPLDSPGLAKENQPKPAITHILEESEPVQTPDVVAAKSIAGLENGEYMVTVSSLGDTVMTCATGIAWMFVGRHLGSRISNVTLSSHSSISIHISMIQDRYAFRRVEQAVHLS